MRIGFDAKRAFMNASGLGNYSRTLLRSLLNQYPENKYVAFTPGIREGLGKDLAESGKLKMIFPSKLMRSFLSSWWRTSLVSEDIRSEQLDIFHGLSNELPKRIQSSTKKVVTIHDLIFLRHPEWYPFFDRNIYYKKSRRACKSADAIITVSEQTRRDIMFYFNTPAEKIHVIYQGFDNQFTGGVIPEAIENFKKKNNLKEYLLYVGTVEERKDLLTLVKAMEELPGVTLVVIGRRTSYSERVDAFIRKQNLSSRILFKDYVSSEELKYFYHGACAFIYPSLYEGFGIPVIEALACGLPVVATANSALPEAGGPSSVYFAPGDYKGLAKKIGSVLEDQVLRAKMISGGMEYVKQFSPELAATKVMDVYKKLVNEKGDR